MATFKTPEELRAWSRSFYNKSSIIKRGRYNYISEEDKKNSKSDSSSNSDVSDDLVKSIIAKGNASNANISELLSLDASTIDEMNSKFPSTEEQISILKNTDMDIYLHKKK